MPTPLAEPEIWSTISDGYTSELVPMFTLFTRDAIRLAELSAGADLIDVAAGPGTLALEAAPTAGRVVAVDFAEGMVETIRRRAAEAGAANVEAIQADGMSLPFDDASFDAAFSMFGLIFFPDRAAGFRELFRVLRPGGHAVVSSWVPFTQVPVLVTMYGRLAELLPSIPFGRTPLPLSDPEDFQREMNAAGFRDVEIHTIVHHTTSPSVEEYWKSNLISSANIVFLRKGLDPAEWDRIADDILTRLVDQFGTGPIDLEWTARLGVGIR